MDVQHDTPPRLLRLRQVLSIYPVSRSTWYQGVSDGRYPKPFKIAARSVAWRESDIHKLVRELDVA